MRVYRKKFKVSESFPVERGQTWQVRQAGKVAEDWLVLDVRHGHKEPYFIAEITEYFHADGVPRSRT